MLITIHYNGVPYFHLACLFVSSSAQLPSAEKAGFIAGQKIDVKYLGMLDGRINIDDSIDCLLA